MKKIFFISFLLLAISVYGVSAQETETATYQEEAYVFPEIKPNIYVYGGYRFVDLSGSERADEYEYLHDSLVLGGELRVFSFPHRLHLEIDEKNRKDYFGDVTYSYKDLVVFRAINRTLFHNLENISLIDLNPATPSPGVAINDEGEKYGVKVGISSAFLRFKTPDFPFHIYVDGSLIDKDGLRQQRSMAGSAYFNNIVRASQSRDVDWQTKAILIGANSHLGPVEIDLSHGEKRFDVGGDKVLADTFAASTVRPGGTFFHNLISETKSSSNTLKLHTSYTGSIVASATFSKVDAENRDSGAKADYFFGSGEVVWMPLTKLTFLVKYRHRERDVENPETVTITDLSNPSSTITSQVRPLLSSISDKVSGAARYRPVSGLTLRAEYSYEDIRRGNTDEWFLRESTRKGIASLSADVKLLKGLKLKLGYTHREADDPTYNIEPDNSDEGKISISWVPLRQVNALLSYNIAREKRSALRFVHTDPATFEEVVLESPGDREVKKDRLLGSVTLLIMKGLSATASYFYSHERDEEDLAFHDTAGEHHFDERVPNRSTAHSYVLDVNYIPEDHINLNAGVSHTISRGFFVPGSSSLLEPVSVASFSELKIRETVFSASGEYRFKNGFALGIQYRYSNFNDVLDNPNDDAEDGKAHIAILTLSKRW